MCPFCFATVGLIVAGTVSTGSLAALAVKMTRKKNAAETLPTQAKRSKENVNPDNR
jgi:hypothetical protein